MLRSATASIIAFTFVFIAFVACSAIALPASQRATIDRSGVLNTREGLTLKVIADEGSIRIVPLDRGASPVVRYTVHVETDLRGNQAQQILEHYSITAKTTLSGVELVGALPRSLRTARNFPSTLKSPFPPTTTSTSTPKSATSKQWTSAAPPLSLRKAATSAP